jgi:hypothetical protein
MTRVRPDPIAPSSINLSVTTAQFLSHLLRALNVEDDLHVRNVEGERTFFLQVRGGEQRMSEALFTRRR